MRHKKADIRRLAHAYLAKAGYEPADWHWKNGCNLVVRLPGDLEVERRSLRIALKAGTSTRQVLRRLGAIPMAGGPASLRPAHQIDLEELISLAVLKARRATPRGAHV